MAGLVMPENIILYAKRAQFTSAVDTCGSNAGLMRLWAELKQSLTAHGHGNSAHLLEDVLLVLMLLSLRDDPRSAICAMKGAPPDT